MNPIVKNILGVIAGVATGAVINMAIIMLSGHIIAPPAGADLSTEEGLKQSMHLMQPKHFVMPFLAHAIGTLAGGFLAALIAASRKMTMAIIVGVFFLAGGIMEVLSLPSPAWFSAVDLILAYIPMAWIGGMFAIRNSGNRRNPEASA